ncbi:MAG: PilZ domain-containing protein [Treponema sp.]|jgi:hypothetical protein|nr:PilZ domain-containing protein [Treponema sp.]
MLFMNKEKTANGVSSNETTVRAPRYTSVARLCINGFEGEAVIRNISLGGFRMESRTYAAITIGEHYIMQIKPEASAQIPLFELEVEVRWVQSTESSFSAGFLIKSSFDRSLEKYIDYIKSHK